MKGISLIEVLVAMFIFSVMILNVGAMSLQSLKITHIALNKTQALMQEDM